MWNFIANNIVEIDLNFLFAQYFNVSYITQNRSGILLLNHSYVLIYSVLWSCAVKELLYVQNSVY